MRGGVGPPSFPPSKPTEDSSNYYYYALVHRWDAWINRQWRLDQFTSSVFYIIIIIIIIWLQADRPDTSKSHTMPSGRPLWQVKQVIIS